MITHDKWFYQEENDDSKGKYQQSTDDIRLLSFLGWLFDTGHKVLRLLVDVDRDQLAWHIRYPFQEPKKFGQKCDTDLVVLASRSN
mmetsp:Transcript_17881/g.26453  ORF Transcript_17881/g.26453 Transcript_17881/m.26453 type:complete len:86 (-) Transcript_17881:1049-1306(-)